MKRLWIAFAALLAVLLSGCGSLGYAGQDNSGTAVSTTPGADQANIWERHRFFDVWNVAYPPAWTVDRPGTGDVVLSGAYGAHQYHVTVVRPTDVTAKDLPTWVQSDLETINQGGAPRQEVTVTDLSALKVTNLTLPGQACPAVRVYASTDKLRGAEDYLTLTVVQTDASACDAASAERLADALIAQLGR